VGRARAKRLLRRHIREARRIKLQSGDGGGFFNANSAHPFENPTPLTNLAEMVLIFASGAAPTDCFGGVVQSERQGLDAALRHGGSVRAWGQQPLCVGSGRQSGI